LRRGERDLPRREAPHPGQSRGGRRPRADGPPGNRAAYYGHARIQDVVWRHPIPTGKVMALRLVFGLLALAAISACSSSDSAGNMYARDPYAVSASRNPASFSEAFGSPKLPARYQSGALDEIYGRLAAMAGASVLTALDYV